MRHSAKTCYMTRGIRIKHLFQRVAICYPRGSSFKFLCHTQMTFPSMQLNGKSSRLLSQQICDSPVRAALAPVFLLLIDGLWSVCPVLMRFHILQALLFDFNQTGMHIQSNRSLFLSSPSFTLHSPTSSVIRAQWTSSTG